MRSLLFVPGDSERKFEKACGSGADVLILDLEDSVAPAQKDAARAHVRSLLDADKQERSWSFFVRPNPGDTGLTGIDLESVVRPGLDGLLLPKINHASEVAALSEKIAALEAANAMAEGSVRIAVVATETPAAMFNLGSYAPPHPRLAALTWGAEDLAAAIGATSNKEDSGNWSEPYRMARSLCLYAAAAAGVAPLDTLYSDFKDSAGLAADCRRARRDGFTGRIAIHPDQVGIINEYFSPSQGEIEEAQRIVAAFEAQPDAGTLGIDGKMYDIPHLKAARRTLASLDSETI